MRGLATKPRIPARRHVWYGRGLLRDSSGISMVEFALVLPVILTLGLYGADIARLATTNMRISQIAISVADNASRLGQTDNSGVQPTITEGNVDAVLDGAMRDGASVGLPTQGRIVLSSLEFDPGTDRHYIHWQRCRGAMSAPSRYGAEDPNQTGTPITGMGSGSTRVTAQSGQSVMFVEITYRYTPLFQNPFGSGSQTLRKEAAFITRDDRNLGPGLTGGSSQSPCT